ncbi:hypothetical protein CH333_05695 [candidate division WOR-3 bacterium JGI_Cruoil_03_44_89]|uniref:Serine protease n=1 Tax=candidate division WOR-3 bacterium JGI_Cruoil_03_44_89 TaxID=1973748 RepID=A0A235BT07_UNCW3|nr:MAG: hypothetical protein CH333_05695 [candidate division WOR-3 bacterium JGI_Cruoil_03_44_89]
MKTLSDIRPIKHAAETDLLKCHGVTGVDIGYKYVGGKKTEVLAIRVYVEAKKNEKDIPKKELIPKTIKGVKTDVIQRKFVLHPLRVQVAEIELKTDTGTYDPLRGGISIGPCRSVWLEPPDVPAAGWYIFVGTLGVIVRDNVSGDPMLLSNFHVMCVDDGWSVGDTMCQPSRLDGGNCPTDVVGALQRASLGGQVDCAVASHTARGYACGIVDIGDVAGKATATVGMAVRKRGRTTELTYGIVDTVDLTVTIPYGDGLGSVTLTNQIGIDVDPAHSPQFGDHGDSGSVVIDNARRVVGLHFAGNEDGTYGVANPIQAVLDALNVSICVPKAKEVEKKIEIKERLKEFKEIEKKIEYEKMPEKKIEIKERFKEFKEPKEIRERVKTPGAEGFPIPPIGPAKPIGSAEERLARLETAVNQLTHFIRPELRPDLGAGALTREPDLSSSDLSTLSRQLQKQAADAKQAKDNKDVEKPREA